MTPPPASGGVTASQHEAAAQATLTHTVIDGSLPPTADSRAVTLNGNSTDHPNILDKVRQTTAAALPSLRAYVEIDDAILQREVTDNAQHYKLSELPPTWAQFYHYAEPDTEPELTAMYVLVLDSLNFCFWPLQNYEYVDLALALKHVALKTPQRMTAKHLLTLTADELQQWLQPLPLDAVPAEGQATVATEFIDLTVEPPQVHSRPPNVSQAADAQTLTPVPLLHQRVTALQELGAALLQPQFGGSALQFIAAAHNSAEKLVQLLTSQICSFRDAAVHPITATQAHFYKRAQICVGDLYGAFSSAKQNKQYGTFHDLHKLTCFADYRVPQLLHSIGIMKYGKELDARIARGERIAAGSVEEHAIRCATVQAVERLRDVLSQSGGQRLAAYQLDWLLWERGEYLQTQKHTLPPHHRTLTVFY